MFVMKWADRNFQFQIRYRECVCVLVHHLFLVLSMSHGPLTLKAKALVSVLFQSFPISIILFNFF